jgi:hypothetical protein
MKAITSLFYVLLLASASTAHAGSASFIRTDRNADGFVSPEEAYKSLKGLNRVHFDKCDRDNDAMVSRTEYGCLSTLYDQIYRKK